MSAIRTSLSILLGAFLGLAAVHAASPLASDTVSRADHAAAQKSAQDADIIRSLLVGEFAVQSGDSELAWKAFLTAAQKGRSAEAAGRAFDIAQEADNEEAADQALKVWTELDPNNRQVRLIKAEELFSQGKYDEAGELVKGLVQAARDPAGALDELGGMQQVAPAKDLFYHAFVKAAVDLKEDARAQLVLSELANRARMTPQAAMHASKAMDLAPDSPHVLMKGIDAEFQNDPKKVSATGVAQSVKIEKQHQTLETVFEQVESQTGLLIMFSNNELNMNELGKDNIEQLAQKGKDAWNQVLGKIEVEGGNLDQYRTFYSCLYRSLLFPRKFYELDANGQPIHYSPYNGQVLPGYMFTDTGFWDTFRCLFPLLNLMYPSVNKEMQEGLINTYLESGFFPEWASPGHRGCMVGNNSASILVDAYMKGPAGIINEAVRG